MSQFAVQKTNTGKIRLLTLLVDRSREFPVQPSARLMKYLEHLIDLNRQYHTIVSEPYEAMYQSFLQWQRGETDSALNSIKKCIDLFDEQKRVAVMPLYQIRIFYNRLNRQEERFQFYKQKLDYYLLNGPSLNAAACYYGLAGYYYYRADYNQAINLFFKGASICKGLHQGLYADEIGTIGFMYTVWGNDGKADHYLKEALELSKKLHDSVTVAYSLTPLIVLNLKKKKHEEALAYANEALQHTHSNVNDPAYAIAAMQKFFVYLAMGKPNMAYPYLVEAKSLKDRFDFQTTSTSGPLETDFGFYKYYRYLHNTKVAATYLLTAYDRAVAGKSNVLQLKYLKELATFYEQQDPALSVKYYARYFDLVDAIEKDNGRFKVAQYENEQKELEQDQRINTLKQERAIQETKISQRNSILWVSFSALALIVLSMIFLYRQYHFNRKTLRALRKTQRQLITAEKMASLAELTAGIAHEIQNPLNFVNNFSELNTELIEEMETEAGKGNLEQVLSITKDIKGNEQKINHHGKRADAIVKGMLQHSRNSNGTKENTDINALADEYLRLAYHGLRAKDKSFNARLVTDYDQTIGLVNIISQDIGRVILNLITNAFYAVRKRKELQEAGYEPVVSISTKKEAETIVLKVRDNGRGIPQNVINKIFQPFFTTKPAGEGTGLGLSMSYEIITKAHGGELLVDSVEGDYTEFTIVLPKPKN
jgi:signal transduction histidine kinase